MNNSQNSSGRQLTIIALAIILFVLGTYLYLEANQTARELDNAQTAGEQVQVPGRTVTKGSTGPDYIPNRDYSGTYKRDDGSTIKVTAAGTSTFAISGETMYMNISGTPNIGSLEATTTISGNGKARYTSDEFKFNHEGQCIVDFAFTGGYI